MVRSIGVAEQSEPQVSTNCRQIWRHSIYPIIQLAEYSRKSNQGSGLGRTFFLDSRGYPIVAQSFQGIIGVGSVSIVRLAAQLGVTRGSFYHHFSDRDELLRSMLDYWEQVWTLSLRNQIRMLEVNPIEKLVALVKLIR